MNRPTVYTIAGLIALGALGALFLIPTTRPPATLSNMLTLYSGAFKDGGLIPPQYTCEGEGISPPLAIDGIPAGTKTLALVVDDPDAPGGTWDHWIVFNIPPSTSAVGPGQEPPGTQGDNSWGRPGWGGPCPPSGEHRYIFMLYALDGELGLSAGASRDEVLGAMQGHVLGQAQLVGRYRKANK